MTDARQLALFFYFWDYRNDPESPLLSETEIQSAADEAQNFINAVDRLLFILMTNNYENEIDMQADIYEIGKSYYGTDKKDLLLFFKRVYQITSKSSGGPRLSNLIRIMGKEEFCRVIRRNMSNLWHF